MCSLTSFSLAIKDNQVFLFGRRGCGCVGRAGGIFLFELKYEYRF